MERGGGGRGENRGGESLREGGERRGEAGGGKPGGKTLALVSPRSLGDFLASFQDLVATHSPAGGRVKPAGRTVRRRAAPTLEG